MNTRKCFLCAAPIDECMGFVVARDILPYLLGQVPKVEKAREMCGKCACKNYDISIEAFELLLASHPL